MPEPHQPRLRIRKRRLREVHILPKFAQQVSAETAGCPTALGPQPAPEHSRAPPCPAQAVRRLYSLSSPLFPSFRMVSKFHGKSCTDRHRPLMPVNSVFSGQQRRVVGEAAAQTGEVRGRSIPEKNLQAAPEHRLLLTSVSFLICNFRDSGIPRKPHSSCSALSRGPAELSLKNVKLFDHTRC